MDYPGLDVADERVRKLSLEAMPTEIGVADHLILHMNHGLSPLSGESNDRGLNFLAMLLLNRAFGSLWRAREDAVCGHPIQCLMLCRAALEDWGTLLYVERHPETQAIWLADVLEEVASSERPPRFKDIWSDLGHLGERADETYGVLSLFAHPRGRGLPWLYHLDEAGIIQFHAGGHFDGANLTTCLYFLIIVAQITLERIAQLQARVLGDAIRGWVDRGNELTKEAESFLNRVHEKVLAAAPQSGTADEEQD